MGCMEEEKEVGEVMRMNCVVVLWQKPFSGAFVKNAYEKNYKQHKASMGHSWHSSLKLGTAPLWTQHFTSGKHR